MAQKSDLIAAIQFTHNETLAFAGELSEAERSTPGLVDHWTAHDIFAHLAFSNRQMAETLDSARHGDAPPAGLNNEEVYHLYKGQPWENIFAEIRQTNFSLLEQVQALSEAELNAPAEWSQGRLLWRIIAGNAILHPLIHLAQAYIERGAGQEALQLDERMYSIVSPLDDTPDWQGMFLYNTGCFYALLGNKPLALENLEKSYKLSPRMLEVSKQDTDLVSLQRDPDFLALLGRFSAPQQASGS